MENPLIMLQNITLAVRAKNILEKAGIRGYVQKTPRTNNRANCGYSVYVPDNTDKAEEILKNKGFVILGRAGRVKL
ncbi:MAG: DUF3343 domain-containing protein [Ruminococcus sp.]|nr:DUF3343 domain-containing protein [Ruminococcus sp.]